MRNAVILLAVLSVMGPLASSRAAEEKPRQSPMEMRSTIQNKTSESRYLLYLPDGYEDSDERKPLLIFLHGAGERGSDIEAVKKHGPPRMIAESHSFPFIVVSPQCPRDERWKEDFLVDLLDHIIETCRVDEDRVYVTGLSMGGYGTWTLAAAAPDRLAAIVPICGGGDPSQAERIKHIPAWVFHGAKDTAVDLSKSTEMVNALYSAGADTRFTVYPEGGHVDAWRNAYSDPAMWAWLEAQRRE